MNEPLDVVTPFDATHAEGLTDWRFQLGALVARFDTQDYAVGARIVAGIAEAAARLGHHPDVDLRPSHVLVRTTTRELDAVTGVDLELARAVSGVATEAGAVARPDLTSSLELAIDTVDADVIRPFWAAVLGYTEDEHGSLLDPSARHAPLWFQEMDPARTDRNRIHLDLSVPHDVARQRVAAALAAGGRLVSDERAPAFWVLADAEGNEVCVCTWQNRSGNGEPGQA